MALYKNIEALMMYVTSLNLSSISIHLNREAEIALLLTQKIKIVAKYSDFFDVFLEEKALKLLEVTDLN